MPPQNGLGWLAVLIFVFIIIVGAYVLPTVLIGIVVISFEEASRKSSQVEEMMSRMATIIGDAQEQMPWFFTTTRIEKLRCVFEEMDADGELTLDINEMTPFFEYAFQKVFDVKLTKEQQEQLFHLMVRLSWCPLDLSSEPPTPPRHPSSSLSRPCGLRARALQGVLRGAKRRRQGTARAGAAGGGCSGRVGDSPAGGAEELLAGKGAGPQPSGVLWGSLLDAAH